MVKFSLSLCKRPLIEIFFSVIEMAQTDEHASTLWIHFMYFLLHILVLCG
jgi:hypothetical protein